MFKSIYLVSNPYIERLKSHLLISIQTLIFQSQLTIQTLILPWVTCGKLMKIWDHKLANFYKRRQALLRILMKLRILTEGTVPCKWFFFVWMKNWKSVTSIGKRVHWLKRVHGLLWNFAYLMNLPRYMIIFCFNKKTGKALHPSEKGCDDWA